MTDLLHVLPFGHARRAHEPYSHDVQSQTRRLQWLAQSARNLLSGAQVGGSIDHDAQRQVLALRMRDALTAEQWTTAAQQLDLLEGSDSWKRESITAHDEYDPDLIRTKLAQLDDARNSGDVPNMLHLVRTALSRDLGGMRNTELYKYAYVGTKDVIERYVTSAVETIETLIKLSGVAETLPSGVHHQGLLESLLFARQSFGRSALLLSGGGTFGMMHIGVAKALHDAQLLPRIVSGASAGSIVASILCATTDEDIPALLEVFPYGDLAVFEPQDQDESIAVHLRRLLTEGCWLDVKHLTRVMRNHLGDVTFQEAYNRTRRICNISVSTESMYELPSILNYVTAPNVMMWSAVAASCSVPFVFISAPLLVKDPATGAHIPWNPTPQRWVDGSVGNDIPMTRLAEMFNVNHFIVSQVNPHVVPFLSKEHRSRFAYVGTRESLMETWSQRPWLNTLATLAKDEVMHRLHFMAELGIAPNMATKFRSVLSQKYSGDINILPELGASDLPRILKNPDVDFMKRALLAGERATWPKLSQIRDRCAIELALDRAIHELRTRVVFNRSQNSLRHRMTRSEEIEGGVNEAYTNRKRSLSMANDESAAPGTAGLPALMGTPRPTYARASKSHIELPARASSHGFGSASPGPVMMRGAGQSASIDPARLDDTPDVVMEQASAFQVGSMEGFLEVASIQSEGTGVSPSSPSPALPTFDEIDTSEARSSVGDDAGDDDDAIAGLASDLSISDPEPCDLELKQP